MNQKKTIHKKAPKRVKRGERSSAKKRIRSPFNEEEKSDERSTKDRRTKSTQRVERVEHSSLKKRARTPSEEEEESDERNKKRNKYHTKNCATEAKGGGSKVDLVSDRLIFLLTFTNRNNDSQPKPVKRTKK